MKLFLISVVFALFALSSAQTPSPSPERPQLVLLSSRERCTPQRVLADVKCGCFYAYIEGLASRAVREECANVLGAPIKSSQAACDPYLLPSQEYNRVEILKALERVKTKCFKSTVTFVRQKLGSFEILKRGEEIFILTNKLCLLFGLPTASDVPAFDRQLVDNENVRADRLRSYNNL